MACDWLTILSTGWLLPLVLLLNMKVKKIYVMGDEARML